MVAPSTIEIPSAGAAGASPWTVTAGVIHPVTLANNVSVGSATSLGKFTVIGDTAAEITTVIRAAISQSVAQLAIQDETGTFSYETLVATGTGKVNLTMPGTQVETIGSSASTISVDLTNSGAGGSQLFVSAGSAGDAFVTLVTTAETWSVGVDQTFAGGFAIANASTLGTGADFLRISADNEWNYVAQAQATGAASENTIVNWGASTITFTTGGAITNERVHRFRAWTLAATAATQTVDKASTVSIDGAPTAGTNVTITAAYALDVTGDTLITGKLTVTGSIDPTDITLSGGGTAHWQQWGAGSTAPLSAASTGRIRYDESAQQFEISANGGAYTPITTGGASPWTSTGTVVHLVTATDVVSVGLSTTGSAKLFANGTSAGLHVIRARAAASQTAHVILAENSAFGQLFRVEANGETYARDPSGTGTAIIGALNPGTGSGASATLCSVNGAGAGDAYSRYVILGVTSWSAGVDNTDDNYVISNTDTPSGAAFFEIHDTTGLVEVPQRFEVGGPNAATVSQGDLTAGLTTEYMAWRRASTTPFVIQLIQNGVGRTAFVSNAGTGNASMTWSCSSNAHGIQMNAYANTNAGSIAGLPLNATSRLASTATNLLFQSPSTFNWSANAGSSLQMILTVSLLTTPSVSVVQPTSTSGTPANAVLVTGAAHTTLTAAEATDINFNLARTVQFTAGGAIASQRAVVIQAPTYAATAAQTITLASTVTITAAPVAGTNVTITNSYALIVDSGDVRIDDVLVFGSSNDLALQRNAGGQLQLDNNAGGTADFVPAADTQGSVGTPSLRFGLIRGVTVTSGDHIFESNDGKAKWRMFEEPDRMMLENMKTKKKYRLVLEEVS